MPHQRKASARRSNRHLIFCALYPPEEAARGICRFTDRMFERGVLNGPRVAPECLHISLNYLGSYPTCPEPLIAKVSDALSGLKRPSFRLTLNRLISFDNVELQPRVLSGDDGLIGIDLLYDAIYLTLRSAGVRCPHPRLNPHLTLSRETRLLPEKYIKPVSWPVREFNLIHSPQGEGRHHVLGCWPLEG